MCSFEKVSFSLNPSGPFYGMKVIEITLKNAPKYQKEKVDNYL